MTTTTIRRLLPVCLSLAALLPLCAGGAAETLDQLYEKAKAEKELVFYAGGPAAPHEARVKVFMQQYPGHQRLGDRRLQQRAERADRKADGGQEARGRHGVLPDRAGFRQLEAPGPAAAIQAGGLRPDHPELPRSRRRLHVAQRQRADLRLQHEQGARRGRAEVGERFSEADVPRQGDRGLSGRRRRRALPVPPHRSEVRLGLDGPVHGQRSQASSRATCRWRAAWPPARTSRRSTPRRRCGRSSARASSKSCSRRSTRRRCSR